MLFYNVIEKHFLFGYRKLNSHIFAEFSIVQLNLNYICEKLFFIGASTPKFR